MSPVVPAVLSGLGRGFGVLVVAGHHQGAAHADLAPTDSTSRTHTRAQVNPQAQAVMSPPSRTLNANGDPSRTPVTAVVVLDDAPLG